MSSKFEIHYLDVERTKRIVLKKSDDNEKGKPFAIIMKDDVKGGYIVHKLEDGKVRHKSNYTQARRSACRAT